MADKKLEILIKMRDDIRGAQRSIEGLNRARIAASGLNTALGTMVGIIGAKLLFEFRRLAVEGPRALIRTRIEADRIINTLRITEGGGAAATKKFKELFDISQQFGRSFPAVAQGFARLSAAAKGTNLEGKKTEDLLKGLLSASTALTLSTAETTGIIFAFEQIISKNTVSAEELRRQLGDRLPGAFRLAADSIGVTTQELNKMLESGTLLAEDLLPALSKEMAERFGEAARANAESLQGQIERLKNEFILLKVELGDAGFIDAVSDALAGLSEVIKDQEFKTNLKDMVSLFASLGNVLNSVAEKGLKAAAIVKFIADSLGKAAGTVAFGFDAIKGTNEAEFNEKFPTPKINDIKGERAKKIGDEATRFGEAKADSRIKKLQNLFNDPEKLKESNAALRKELDFATANPQQKFDLLNKELELLERKKEIRQTEAVFERGVEGVLPEDELKKIDLETQKERLEIIKEIARTEGQIDNQKLQDMQFLLSNLDVLAGGFAASLTDAIFGAQNFGQAMVGVLRQVIAKLIEAIIKATILRAILGALGVNPTIINKVAPGFKDIFGKGKASGGLVTGGPQLIPINERGKEFVFDAPSTRNLGPNLLQNLMENARFPGFSLADAVGGLPAAAVGGGGSNGKGGVSGGLAASPLFNPNVNVEGHKGIFNVMIVRNRQEMLDALKSSEGQTIMLDMMKQHSLEIGGVLQNS